MSPRSLLDLLRARRAIAAGLFALGLAGAAVATLVMPARWVATARVLVEPAPGELLPGGTLPAHLATQVDIVTSQRVALRVVDTLRLADDPESIRRWRLETDGTGSLRHHRSDRLLRDLSVEPSGASSVLRISYAADDPATAARIANAFAQAYVELGASLGRDPSAEARERLDARTRSLREQLDLARQRLAAPLLPEVEPTPSDPRRSAAARPVTEIAATGAGTEGAGGDADGPRERTAQIRRLRDELRLLQRDLEQAELAFDAAARRLDASPGRAGGPRPVLLTSASEPARPTRPDPLLNGALGAVFGLLAAIVGAGVAERRDRRIRGPRDLALASGSAPIGSLRDAFGGARPAPEPPLAAGPVGVGFAAGAAPVGGGLGAAGVVAVGGGLGAAGVAAVGGGLGAAGVVAAPSAAASAARAAAAVDDAAGPATIPGPAADGPGARPGVSRDASGSPRPIGEILVQAGLIHPPEVERILAWARREGMRFGEAAVASKLVTTDQIERALAEQFDFPLLRRGSSAVSDEVVAAYDARNPVVADLRRLRARIRAAQLAAPADAPLRCVAVVSAGSGDGKSFLAANLAVTFSQCGQRTLLIDADLRRGRLHALFGLSNATGLSSMLNRSLLPGAMQRVPGLGPLTVLTRGPDAPNPAELLSRDAFGQLLDALSRSFDVVILDTPGVAEEPDAALVAQRAGAALVVARKDRSSFGGLAELVQGTTVPRIAVLGSVLNEA